MPQLQPVVRLVLTAIAAGIAALGAQADSLPTEVQIAITVLAAVFAGIGIVPPQVPTRTTVVAKDGEARDDR